MTKGDRSGADRPAPSPTSIPPGTRDVLPEEMRELRAIGDRMRETFEAAGYGEITTEILDAGELYYAEDYHQQYLAKNPGGYCGMGGTGVACPVGVPGV